MILQSIKMAWASVTANKMRSFLTMLGIIIGVVSLVVLVSLVSGATSSVTEEISSLGTNKLTVSVQDNKGKPLKLDDITALAQEEEIQSAAPLTQASMTAVGSTSEETAAVYGTTGAYGQIEQLELASGRFLKTTDIENHTQVAVVNAGLAEAVYGQKNVTGQTIRFDGVDYQIIGVLQADDSDTTTTETYEAYIPYTTLIRQSNSVSSEVTSFVAAASSEESLDAAEAVLTEIMMERFSQDEDAFTILNQSTIMEAMEEVTGTLSLLLGGIAGISLLVGGIGIMNIMLVSVTERTREIGIRKAVGAARGTIMFQFLVEALMISLLGCAFGIGLSWVMLRLISNMWEMSFSLSGGVVAVSVGFSAAIGVLFGIYPANKAAKKKPIDALRYT